MRSEFIAGIGNAYADEILWAAMIHPYRRRTQLTSEEIGRLYHAMQSTLHAAADRVRVEMGENTDLKPREFLNVHMQTNERVRAAARAFPSPARTSASPISAARASRAD